MLQRFPTPTLLVLYKGMGISIFLPEPTSWNLPAMHLVLLFSCLILSFPIVTAQCTKNPYTRFFTFGDTSALVTSDGPITPPIAGLFAVPDVALEFAYKRLFRPLDPLVWSQNNVIIDHPAGRILIDAGSANFPAPPFANAGLLQQNLLAAGIEPSSIKNVLITHGHADHVSGLVTGDGERAFPNAKIIVPRVEHMFWTAEPFVNPSAVAPNETLGTCAQFCTICEQQALWSKLLTNSICIVSFCFHGVLPLYDEQRCSALFIVTACRLTCRQVW